MTPLIIVILAVMWIVVLAPPLLRSRSDLRNSSMMSFRRHLSTLQTSAPARPMSSGVRPAAAYRAVSRPVSRQAVARAAMRRRRQNILTMLGGGALLTGIIGFGMSYRTFITAHLALDALVLIYIYSLVQIRKSEQSRASQYEWSRAA